MQNIFGLFRLPNLLAFVLLATTSASAQDKAPSEPKGLVTPRTTISEGSQNWCALCNCCSKVMVFDPKKLLKNKSAEEIDSMAVIANQKTSDQIKEIYAKYPPGAPRETEIAKLTVNHDYCQVVPCLKVGNQVRVDWKKLKDDPGILDSMKDQGFVVLPKNAIAKTQ